MTAVLILSLEYAGCFFHAYNSICLKALQVLGFGRTAPVAQLVGAPEES